MAVRRKHVILAAASVAVAGIVIGLLSGPRGVQQIELAAQPPGPAAEGFSAAPYAKMLKARVDANGMVDYRGLKADVKTLDAFLGSAAALDRGVYDKWPGQEKIAFWINVYNAFTLKAIAANYPIRPSFLTSLAYPKNSIRQIAGVWDKLQVVVMAKKMTLNEIEHNVLRKEFNEPRIHVALVCAAMGCPPLRNEPYASDKLAAQLDDQTKRFLANAGKFSIDRAAGRVGLSSIFKWFGGDFVKTHGTDKGFAGHADAERAVLHFVSKYLPEADAKYLAAGKYDVRYLHYDWSLNEQRPKAGE